MRIVWLDIHSSYSHASLALPLLHAASQGRVTPGPDWRAVSATINDSATEVAARVVAERPDLLAGTAYLFTREMLLAVIRRVKALAPECAVVLGGPEFLGDNETFLRREPAVDAVLRGEGELAFAELSGMLGKAGTISPDRHVPGLCRVDASGTYHDHGVAVLSAAEFAGLPSPMASPFFAWDKPFIQLETSRGCSNTCSFCTSGLGGAVRPVPLERVREQLAEIHAHGLREVRILDRTFNLDPRRACALLALFRELCPGTRFHLELHPAWLTAALKAALREFPAGKLHLEVGLQTTHPGALRTCRRKGNLEKSWEGLAFLCGLRNLAVHVDLLAGLPGVTWEWLLADLERVTQLGPEEIQLETLKLLPGTPLAAAAGGLGMVAAPDTPYEVLRSAQMTPEDLLAARRLSRLVDGFYNAGALREVVREAAEGKRQKAEGRSDGVAAGNFYAEFLAALRGTPALEGPTSLETRCGLLHGFLAARSPQLAERAEVAWMSAGLSPARCPGGRASPWKAPVPAAAEVVFRAAGAPEIIAKSAHVWLLEQGDARHWFVFDRGISPHRPVMIYGVRW